MATEIVTIQGVETKTGEKNGKPWKLWKVTLGDGRQLATFKQAQGGAAESAIGERREVDIEERTSKDGSRVDLMLEAVRPAPVTAASTAASGGESVPAQVWEDKDRRIARQVCIKAVVELYAHRDVAIPKTDDLLKRAAEFEQFIYRGTEAPSETALQAEAEDVPFE